jgi:hypothetical protein
VKRSDKTVVTPKEREVLLTAELLFPALILSTVDGNAITGASSCLLMNSDVSLAKRNPKSVQN